MSEALSPGRVVQRLPLHRVVRVEHRLQLRVHQSEVDGSPHARRDGRGGRLGGARLPPPLDALAFLVAHMDDGHLALVDALSDTP